MRDYELRRRLSRNGRYVERAGPYSGYGDLEYVQLELNQLMRMYIDFEREGATNREIKNFNFMMNTCISMLKNAKDEVKERFS